MSTTFCLSVRTECASDDNTTRTDFSHYFRSLAEVVLNTLHLTYKQASKSITTHGWWAEVGLVDRLCPTSGWRVNRPERWPRERIRELANSQTGSPDAPAGAPYVFSPSREIAAPPWRGAILERVRQLHIFLRPLAPAERNVFPQEDISPSADLRSNSHI